MAAKPRFRAVHRPGRDAQGVEKLGNKKRKGEDDDRFTRCCDGPQA